MSPKKFSEEAMVESNPKWENAVSRFCELYEKHDEIRSPFSRDFDRIMHCTAYRRLKHKTQVFFATRNDHVCTRIEHVNHVQSISNTIARTLGLNADLTSAIAIGHDIGHAPFGHAGETEIKKIVGEDLENESFLHEKNSLHFADDIELLPGVDEKKYNLCLTYAVRDGIICHCGENDKNELVPRGEDIDLEAIKEPGSVNPYTWEGCIVKRSDKIAYIGRDIEDAITLGVIDKEGRGELLNLFDKNNVKRGEYPTNTFLIHHFIIDLCNNSDPKRGVVYSDCAYKFLKDIYGFSREYIYMHERLNQYKKYVRLIITTLYNALKSYDCSSRDGLIRLYPKTYSDYNDYLKQYAFSSEHDVHKKIYDMEFESDRKRAAIDFISGMTDHYAMRLFDEIVSF